MVIKIKFLSFIGNIVLGYTNQKIDKLKIVHSKLL